MFSRYMHLILTFLLSSANAMHGIYKRRRKKTPPNRKTTCLPELIAYFYLFNISKKKLVELHHRFTRINPSIRMCILFWLLRFFVVLEIAAISLIPLLKCVSVLSSALWTPQTALPLILLVSVSFHFLAISSFHLCILFHHVNHFVWDSQIFDCTSANVAFRHTPEPVTILQNSNKSF